MSTKQEDHGICYSAKLPFLFLCLFLVWELLLIIRNISLSLMIFFKVGHNY